MSVRRISLLAVAVLVGVFVAFYPYLGVMDMCHSGECPYAAQSSGQASPASSGAASLCLSAVMALSSAGVLARATRRGRRISVAASRPDQLYISPDPHPPRAFS